MTNLFSETKAAKTLGCARQTLAKYRKKTSGPAVKTIGKRYFYRREDLDAWAAGRKK
jgi:predicted site-specific integrase-resolvase